MSARSREDESESEGEELGETLGPDAEPSLERPRPVPVEIDPTGLDSALDADATLAQGREATASGDATHLREEPIASAAERTLAQDLGRTERLEGAATERVPFSDRSATLALGEAAREVLDAPAIPDVTIEGLLGQGGQGIVYRGRQNYLDRRVAVKVLAHGASQGFEVRFQREAKILAGLKHPHVVTCYQAGVTPDHRCFMVMELIEGPDLAQWIHDQGPLACRAALTVTRDVALALEHGYQASIIHRDVKPQNVLLAPSGEEGAFPFRAKLADLGLARGTDADSEVAQLTAQGVVMGTPSSMAPEQFEDPDQVDFRADVYGLGCVLYHSLAGQSPYSGRTLSQVFKQKATGPIPDPSEARPDLPASVVRLVQRMLARDRGDRPQSYRELVAELERELELLAAPPAEAALTRGTGSRFRVPAFVLATLALAFVIYRFGSAPSTPPELDEAASLEDAERGQDGEREEGANATKSADTSAQEVALAEPAAPPRPGPPLESGATIALFEAWDRLEQLLEGWELTPPEPERWNGEDDDLSVLLGHIAGGRLEASRALPTGSWSLTGTIKAFEPYTRGESTADPRAGMLVVWTGGECFELAVAPRGEDHRVDWRWLEQAPEDGWSTDSQRPSGSRQGRGEQLVFELVRAGTGFELRVDGERIDPSSPSTSEPARLTLFVEDGMGRWSNYVLRGR